MTRCKQDESTTNILVRDVPHEIHAVLRGKAARRHQSLQQYLIDELRQHAERRSFDEIFDEIEALDGGHVGFATGVDDLAAARVRG